MSIVPAGWAPAATDLIAGRPELTGIGVTEVTALGAVSA